MSGTTELTPPISASSNMSKSQDHGRTYCSFPSLPYEIRIKIWLLSFPPPSHEPLIRISEVPPAESSGNDDPKSEATSAYKLSTDTTLPQATTTPEYLHARTFLTTCHESKELYIKTFNLTHLIPPSIYYNPSNTTVYIENGLFPTSNGAFVGVFGLTPAPKPAPFLREIQLLALPDNSLDSELIVEDSHWSNWPAGQGHADSYNADTIELVGSVFSQLTQLRHVYIVVSDQKVSPGYVLRYSALADAEDLAGGITEFLNFYKSEYYDDAVAQGTEEGGWEIPSITVLMDGLKVQDGDGDWDENWM